MFLFFSKLITFFISPANWLIALFILLIFSKSIRFKKKLTIALSLFFFVFGNEFLFNKLVNAWQPAPVELTTHYEAGILLGGIASFDKLGNGYLNNASDRFIAISTLYKTGVIKKIVISAGNINKEKPNEAAFLLKRMAQLGIPMQDIIIEGKSRSTFENAFFTKRIIDSLKFTPPYILVSSAMHIPRAVSVFKKAGLEVVPYPCNYTVIKRSFSAGDYLIPKLYIINDWSYFLKEIVGLAGYKIFGKA